MTQRLPSKQRIADAWRGAYGYDTPWGEVIDWGEPQCWACHYYAQSWPDDWNKADGLDRCHIVPKSLGGTSEPLNLVLLCERCHEQSPDHANPEYMFRWMRETPKRQLGTWLPSQSDELGRLTSLAIARNIAEEAVGGWIKDFVQSSGDHFGWTSDGTRQALLWQLAKEIEAAK